ncbi:hypothetical protein C8J57DRAFT_1094363, partial [Mycena rebaudengoi]
KRVILLELDFADLQSVRRAAEAFLGRQPSLDILFNNRCVMRAPPLSRPGKSRGVLNPHV